MSALSLLLYAHIFKGVSYKSFESVKLATYVAGAALFILTLAVCFTGYVLVCGQMSY